MTDLQILVRQTSNPSILKMQQRLHDEVVSLGKQALERKADCEALQLALEVERDAANLYAKRVAHWIEKHDALLAQQLASEDRAQRDAEHLAELRAYELTGANLWEQPAPPEISDAYTGAREDLAIWKKRALEAEETVRQLNRALADEVNGPTFMGEPVIQAQPERKPMTEDEIVKCLVESSCTGKVMMSFESGPYDITRPSITADKLIRAIEALHGIKEES